MDPEAALAIAPYLEPGESLLWSGRPRQGLLFRTSDILLIPASILWCLGMGAGFVAIFVMDRLPILQLFTIPFAVMGVYFLFGRFFLNAWQRSKTFYGFTQHRIIIVWGPVWRSIQSLHFKTLTQVSLEELRDRSGNIHFGANNPWYNLTEAARINRLRVRPSIELIDDVRSVYERMREAHARAT